jgi:hypothetical protein
MNLTEKETEEIIEVDKFESIIALILVLIMFITLIAFSIYEYKDWQDIKSLIKENNGSCYKDGLNLVCSYSEPAKSVITSISRCYIGNTEVNCSSEEFEYGKL